MFVFMLKGSIKLFSVPESTLMVELHTHNRTKTRRLEQLFSMTDNVSNKLLNNISVVDPAVEL